MPWVACIAAYTVTPPPHPVEHVKHVHLGMFYMFVASLTLPIPSNTKNTPIWVCFSCLPPPSPLKHESHAHLGVSMFFFHFDTTRRAAPFLSCLCFNFDTARKSMALLVVFVALLFQCGKEGSLPPHRHMYF